MKGRYTEKRPQKVDTRKKSNQVTRKFCSLHRAQSAHQPYPRNPTKTSPKGRKRKQKKPRNNPFLFPFPRDACLTFVHFLFSLCWCITLSFLLDTISRRSFCTGASSVILLTGLNVFVIHAEGFVNLCAESRFIIKPIERGKQSKHID